MKKFFPLCLALIVLCTWAVAGADNNPSGAAAKLTDLQSQHYLGTLAPVSEKDAAREDVLTEQENFNTSNAGSPAEQTNSQQTPLVTIPGANQAPALGKIEKELYEEDSRPEINLPYDPPTILTTGDDCSDPIVITVTDPNADLPVTLANQYTCARLNSYSSTCLGSYDGGEDIIFRLDLAVGATLDFTCDFKATTYTGFLVDDACPPDPSACLGKVTSYSGGVKAITGLTLAAGSYYIMADTWPTPNCIPDFDLTISAAAPPPANDDCANAEAVGEVTDLAWSTVTASVSGLGTCMTSADIWYYYTATADGNAVVSLCGSAFDTKLAAYSGADCASLVEIACNDDAPCVSASFQSEIEIPGVTIGSSYWIQVGGYSNNVGSGILNISVYTPPPAPANDDCANAEAIVGPYPVSGTGTTIGATLDCPGMLDWNAVWYTIDLPYASNDITITYCGTTEELYQAGVVIMNDCLCDDYTLSTYAWDPTGCASGYSMTLNFSDVPMGVWYWPALANNSAYDGIDFEYTVNVTEVVPCVVTCPDGSTPEGEEDCYDEYVDVTNGGCNSTPAVWGAATCGETICGTAGTYLFGGSNYRDTDWYLMTLASTQIVTITGEAEFPLLMFLIDLGPAGDECNGYVISASGSGDECTPVTVSSLMPAGQIAVWVGPSVFTGVPCGSDYYVSITCEDPPPPPTNDLCADAIPVAVPSSTQGTTVNSTPDTEYGTCGTSITSAGVWYTIPGTGNTMTATTCNAYTDYDTKISVFCGTCTDFYCVDGNDDNCSEYLFRSTVTWCTEVGRDYMVLVHGYSSAVGNFQLDVFDDGVACDTPPLCTPCVVDCPTGGYPEGEPICGDQYVDAYNGGCNASPAVFQTVNAGDIICAETGTFLFDSSNYRDTDWYEIVLDQDGTLTWTVEAEFDGILAFVIAANSGDCVDYTILGSAIGDRCTPTTLSFFVTAGTYWLWAGPSFFSGLPCGSVYNGYVTVSGPPEGACCVATDCVGTMTQADCDALQGVWYEGEDCATFTCPEPPVETCSDASLWDNGVADLVNGYRPSANWDPLGIIDDIQLTASSDVSCFRIEIIEGTTPLGDPSNIMSMRVRIYDAPNGIYALAWDVDGANPVFDYTFDKTTGNLDEIDSGVDAFARDLVWFDACDPAATVTLAAGTYGVFVNFPGRGPDDFFWATATNSHANELSAVWGETINIPSANTADMAFHLGVGDCAGGDPTAACCVGTDCIGDMTEADCLAANGTWYVDETCATFQCPAGGCDYVVGDVNGSNTYNGLDITYGVAYFKGGAAPQCNTDCDCFTNFCGDVNGSNTYNGLDITYGVAYFKGGAAPQDPPDCPPGGGILGEGNNPLIVPGLKSKATFQPGSASE